MKGTRTQPNVTIMFDLLSLLRFRTFLIVGKLQEAKENRILIKALFVSEITKIQIHLN